METAEEAIIRQIQRASQAPPARLVRLGIGDDTAVVRMPAGSGEVLLTTDQIIENTHFIRSRHPAAALGHKTLARGLSDIAAMGGKPVCFLLSLCLPEWARGAWLKHYIYGMFRLGRTHYVPCVGGDVARGERFTAAITVVGTTPPAAALTRHGARPGDLLYVSGSLGGSTLGLTKLLSRGASRGAAVHRHLYPEPRLALGSFLRRKPKASAAIDLSDGLSTDLSRLARSSRVGAEIDAAAIPVFRGATFEQALHGGEEYELLFTVKPSTRVPASFEGVPLTRIGRIRKQRGVVIRSERSVEVLEPRGFEHFESRP